MANEKVISFQEIARQREYMAKVRNYYAAQMKRAPKAFNITFGCQQNVADTELMKGMLRDMGFDFADTAAQADLVLINTCTVREHADMRAFGNVGELSHEKQKNPHLIIAVCGCMAQRPQAAEKLRKSYPYVDLVFGPHAVYQFPQLLWRRLSGEKRVFETQESEGVIVEGVTPVREQGAKAWLSVMYGCNNFCSYCVVPYVRGRERSRSPQQIISELHELVDSGVKDITLLGQNVNSYGAGLEDGCGFPELLRRLNEVKGDFRIRFMTSHPKDATSELFDAMAGCSKVCRSIHLPVQAGSDRILHLMNRKYTVEQYKKLVDYARMVMPDITMTSDIIVGFPGETEEDFQGTLRLLEEIRFDSLFTFIYSKREPSAAAAFPDPVSREEKQERFDRLLAVQNRISKEINDGYVGRTMRVLLDGESPGEHNLTGRTEGFKLVHIAGDPNKIGNFVTVKIEKSSTWALIGSLEEG